MILKGNSKSYLYSRMIKLDKFLANTILNNAVCVEQPDIPVIPVSINNFSR